MSETTKKKLAAIMFTHLVEYEQYSKNDEKLRSYLYVLAIQAENNKQYQTVAKLNQKAADLGHADSMFNLALMYRHGKGVEKDLSKAIFWYVNASYLEHPNSMFNLSLLYEYGFGVKKDLKEAVEWCKKAAELNYEKAIIKLTEFSDDKNLLTETEDKFLDDNAETIDVIDKILIEKEEKEIQEISYLYYIPEW